MMKPKHITNIDWNILIKKYPLNIEEIKKKLEQHYPVQYLIGNVDFYDCIIKVNENVLIPRFETELLVEKVLKKITQKKILLPQIIDLGTGSGCIAIAIKKYINCSMTALDISEKALELAKENANKNKVKIKFIKEDIKNVDLSDYQIIISNPPYVEKNEYVGKETKYEPQNAIFAEEEGTYFYRIILENIKRNNLYPILIAFEIGMNQGTYLKNLSKELFPEYKFSIEKDYQNRDRFVFLEKIM